MTIETHPIDFYPEVSGGVYAQFESVEARFSVEWDRPDPGVGAFYWNAKAELIDFKIGTRTVNRYEFCEWLSEAEVNAIEERVSEAISERGEAA